MENILTHFSNLYHTYTMLSTIRITSETLAGLSLTVQVGLGMRANSGCAPCASEG